MENKLRIKAGQWSDAGVKAENEDSCGIRIGEGLLLSSKGIVAVIADGMSGSSAGREAAESCVQGFLTDYFGTAESWTVKTSGLRVLSALNRWLYGVSHQKAVSGHGLVTTLSVLVLKSATAHLFHVGDTRIYRLRGDTLECLTHDHRVIVTGERTYLSRAMGIDLHLEIDYRQVPLEKGDLFLLTSDGIHDYLEDATLAALLQQYPDQPEETARSIGAKAIAQKSDDNVTAQVVHIEELADEELSDFYAQLTELPFPPPLEPGMTMDGYAILRELFASNRTQIYLALDSVSDQKVVLKTPSVNFEDDPEYIDSFLKERWAGGRIDNPHVLKILDPERKRTFLYYVMEFVEGQNLREWMDENPEPSLVKVKDIVVQVAKGLQAFHRLEMTHRDIKPENLIIDEHGTVKIADFGSTKIAGLEEIHSPFASDHHVGTFNYSAPEIVGGESGSNRSDIFSLGVIAYELMTNRLPYGKTTGGTLKKKWVYVPTSRYNPAIPLWIDKALEKTVSQDPRRRHSTLSEFVYDLSHPNPDFLRGESTPLLERDPLAFWRGLALLLLVLNIVLIFLLAR